MNERLNENTRSMYRKAVMLIGSMLLVASCGQEGKAIIEGDKHAVVTGKTSGSSHESGTGDDQWEDAYSLTVEQCERTDIDVVGPDGCITVVIDTNPDTYMKFDIGEGIIFHKDRRGDLAPEN